MTDTHEFSIMQFTYMHYNWIKHIIDMIHIQTGVI